MVLSGDLNARNIGLGTPNDDEDSGDSMVSFEYAPSEVSFNPPHSQHDPAGPGAAVPKRSASQSRRGPLSSNPPHQRTSNLDDDVDGPDTDVPPVPPLPNASSSLSPVSDSFADDIAVQDYASKTIHRKPSRGGRSLRIKQNKSEESGKSMDLQELLLGIDSRSGEGSLGNITKPPY